MGHGPDVAVTVVQLHRVAERRGDVIEFEETIEAWNPKVRRMMRA
jgi:hypothetical protein